MHKLITITAMNIHTLTHVRDSLLALHTALLEYQKEQYEQDNTRIASPSQYFQIVTTSPTFAWLRELSELIVSLDELCDEPTAVDERKAMELIAYTKKLLDASSNTEFGTKYQKALHSSPAVALKHGAVSMLLV